MSAYLIRRLLQTVLTFVGATFIVYALMFTIATDPLQALAGEKPLSPSQRAQLTAQYHLDEPFIKQYGYYMQGLVTGNLRQDHQRPADFRRAGESWPRTLQLGLIALLIVIVFGISGGVYAGLRRGGLSTRPVWH